MCVFLWEDSSSLDRCVSLYAPQKEGSQFLQYNMIRVFNGFWKMYKIKHPSMSCNYDYYDLWLNQTPLFNAIIIMIIKVVSNSFDDDDDDQWWEKKLFKEANQISRCMEEVVLRYRQNFGEPCEMVLQCVKWSYNVSNYKTFMYAKLFMAVKNPRLEPNYSNRTIIRHLSYSILVSFNIGEFRLWYACHLWSRDESDDGDAVSPHL